MGWFLFIFLLCNSPRIRYLNLVAGINDAPYGMINRVLTDCEYVGLNVGSDLADTFNAMDEATEFDVRVHSDYLIEHLGFAGYLN
jgi:hypothetical protein